MTLFNVDKDTDDRVNPSVNSVDKLVGRKAHATDSISPRAAGTSGGKITTKNDQIISYDATNQRIIMGRLPDGTYGIAISKPGVDVSSAF